MSKRLFYIVILSVVGILIVLGVYFFNSYRLLENKERAVQESWTVMTEQYQERLDVLASLEGLAKASAVDKTKHTKSIWDVAREANNYKGMVLVTEKIDKEIEATILLIAENPTVKSSEKFLQLDKRLKATEQKISSEQETYNDAVTEYNRQIKVFPASVVAGPLRLSSYSYYQGLDK